MGIFVASATRFGWNVVRFDGFGNLQGGEYGNYDDPWDILPELVACRCDMAD